MLHACNPGRGEATPNSANQRGSLDIRGDLSFAAQTLTGVRIKHLRRANR